MLSFPLSGPFVGWTLLLTPRWGSFGLPAQIALHAAACLAPFLLIFFLYLYEVKLTTYVRSLALLYLRLAALAALLFLVLLQPMFAWTKTWEEPGRVLVAVDRSGSMDVPDPQRKPVDKLRLARALHLNHNACTETAAMAGLGLSAARALPLIHDVCTDAQLDQWIHDYQDPNKKAPPLVRDDERAQHDLVCDLADHVTRTQTEKAILSDEGLGLLSSLAAREKVQLIGFHSATWNVPADRPDLLFGASPPPGGGSASNPAGSTDLSLPLAAGLETAGAGEGRLLGVVLLTDGRQNAGDPPAKKAIELGEREVPIYPVALGSEIAPAQATILALTAPPAVHKGDAAPVDVHFRVAGLRDQDVIVELFRGAGAQKTLIEKRTIHHEGKDGKPHEYRESYQVKMDAAGPQALTATVHPADPNVKVVGPENGDRSAVVSVAGDKARVLLIDGEARWEFHYLQSALKRDATLRTDSVVFDQPRLNAALTDDDLVKIDSPREHLPAGPEALAAYGCIVLGDVSPEQLPPADRKRLEQFVAERGGTLVIVAGKRYMPMAYPEAPPPAGGAQGAGDAAEADPIRKMLPIDKPHPIEPPDGFHPTLTAEGRETKFMGLEDDGVKSEQRWAALPPQFWGVIGQAKPAAATLAFAPAGPADPADPAARERRNALIVQQNYGLGRVLYIGIDSTWRWRKGVGDLYHHRFWGQVTRWAADRPLEIGNDFLHFGAAEPVYRSGQDVELFVRFNDTKDAARAASGAQAQVLRRGGDGKPVAVVQLTRKPAEPNAFEARVPNLPDGDYQIQLKMDAAPDVLRPTPSPGAPKETGPLQASFSVTAPESAEMSDLSMDRASLNDLANTSRGKVYTPEDVQALVDEIIAKNAPKMEHSEDPVWQGWTGWAVFGVVVFLLTVEWVVRKFSGLP